MGMTSTTASQQQVVYADVPPPLGEVVAEYRIDPATAIAYQVKAGQYIQIIDVEGTQCSDFLAFAGEQFAEEIDGTVTRTLNGVSVPQAGLHSKYFSQTMQPLVEVIQDTCDRHDSFLLACTARYYEDAGYPGHISCSENFNQVLAPHGIAARLGWAAINFFFNTSVDASGAIASCESWSRPGDYVLLRAHQDLLCASSACPDDIDPANGWNPTAIHVRVYQASEQFPIAMGRRAAANHPLRLTQDSAFTPKIRELTGNVVDYNGFWVPNCFFNHGDHAEYWALRQRAALMDLSALRKFDLIGEQAVDLLHTAFSRNVANLVIGQSAYGCLLNPHGGMIDDGIVFHLSEHHYRYVGNCDTDWDWLQTVAQDYGYAVEIIPTSRENHNVAIQGPLSRDILRPLVTFDSDAGITLDDLGYFRCATGTVANIPVLISRTGYTGELGYELFVHPADGGALWEALMAAGTPYGMLPLGMLALNRARIEAGLLAAGYEFDDLISPYQAGIGWAVAMKTKGDFIGRTALEQLRNHPPRVAVGLILDTNDVADYGQCVFPIGDRWRVGHVTSGTFSPILNRSIAMAQVVPEYAATGMELEVGFMDGMKRRVKATVGSLAAYDPTKSRVRG